MPEILPTVQLSQEAPRRRAEQIGPGAGAYIGRGLEQLGEVAARLGDASDKAEAARIVSETRALFSSAIDEESRGKIDYNEFNTAASARLNELHAGALQTDNPRVKSLVKGALQDDLIRSQILIRQQTFKKQKDQVDADYGTTLDQLVKSSVGADEATQQRNAADFAVLQASLMNDGFLTKDDARKDRKKFSDEIVIHSAYKDISDGRTDQVYRADSEGKFNGLDSNARRQLMNTARAADEKQGVLAERAHRKVKEEVMNNWQAKANRGELQTRYANEMQDALDGKNPYISAREARELLNVDNNPPTGGSGDDVVRNLRMRYRLTQGTEADIRRAQNELSGILRQGGRQSKVAEEFANELQSDIYRAKGLATSQEANAIQRENRAIRDLQTGYDANKEEMPAFIQRMFGNQDTQNKARIANEFKKGGPDAAKKLAEDLSKGMKSKANAIPERNKKVLELTK